ncbi:hypothetical protein FIBSPDRAFT_755665 [Athelia psychrophila]|uniref:Uncharacterized protein n=1 Tax=Athelia psychrophila TaxID=1759441 RepID=A0A166AU61_9AGAM|nr:hypothetical protein FIBSPDRAFT_755665 [Fibularhizoctonia sp. CBS 109695]
MSFRSFRCLHSTARKCNLIGPPDPISNLRPVLYSNASKGAHSELSHPYSLREFSGDIVVDHDLQWRLHQQDLDAFSHKFWTDSNLRFEAGKESVLASLPENATTLARESAMSKFYGGWVQQETQRQKAYTKEWRARSYDALKYAARVQWRNMQIWAANCLKL